MRRATSEQKHRFWRCIVSSRLFILHEPCSRLFREAAVVVTNPEWLLKGKPFLTWFSTCASLQPVCMAHQSCATNQFSMLDWCCPDNSLTMHWASGNVTMYRQQIWFSASLPSKCVLKSCINPRANFHLCSSRPLASGSILAGATRSKPKVFAPAGTWGYCWETVNEWGLCGVANDL